MRGIAAIAVACFHASQLLVGEAFFHGTPALAVDFFFCLSGFVVAYAYGSRLEAGLSLRDFAIRRVIRLYPMVLLGAALGALVLAMGALRREGIGAAFVTESAGAFLLLPTGLLFQAQAYPTNNPVWSLFFEAVANAVYAAARTCGLALLGVGTAAAALALVLVSYRFDGLGDVGFKDGPSFLAGFVRVCYPFLAGVLIHRLGLYRALPRIPVVVGLLALVAALSFEVQPVWIAQAVLAILVFPAIVVLGANARAGRSHGAMVWLGQISYPLYLIHQPLLRVVKNVPALAGPVAAHPVAAIVVSVAGCCAVSTLVFHAYDVKVRNWAASALRRRRGRRVQPA